MGMRVVVPSVGWAESGVLREWHKEDGDWINVGAALCTLQVGPTKHSLTALDSGFLRLVTRRVPVGGIVRRGDLLGLILAPGESPDPLIRGLPPMPARVERHVEIHERLLEIGTTVNPQRGRSSPRARRMARDAGIRWERLQGSGLKGRITARDVEAAARRRPSQGVLPESYQLLASATFSVTEDGGTVDFQAAADDLFIRVFHLLRKRSSGKSQPICFAFPSAAGVHYCSPHASTETLTPLVIEDLRARASEKTAVAGSQWLLQDVVAFNAASLVMPLPVGYQGAVVIGRDQDFLRVTVIADQRVVTIYEVLELLRELRC